MDYNLLAGKILSDMGGKENISYFGRCMSRLRFAFDDVNKVNFNQLKGVREILSLVRCGEEVYLVIRRGLPHLYSAINKRLSDNEACTEPEGLIKYLKWYKIIIGVSAFIYSVDMLINGHIFAIIFATMLISFSVAVIADFFLGLISFEDDAVTKKGVVVVSPVRGWIIRKTGDDKSGVIFIKPDTNDVVSPVDGWVEEIHKNGHAVLIRSCEGFGVFIHIGIDTVNSKGCFTAYVNKGDRVKAGERIIEFDDKALSEKGYSLSTLIEITDNDDIWVASAEGSYATEGRPLIRLESKLF